MIIFGAIGIFAKLIDMASSEIALSMSVIGSLFLLGVFAIAQRSISWATIKSNLAALLVSSIALSGNWVFLFQSYKHTTIAYAALSYYFAPILVIIVSPIVLKEKLSFKKISGVVTAFLGLMCIMLNGGTDGGKHYLLGIFFGLVAAAFYATLTLSNKFVRNMKGLDKTLVEILLSVAFLMPYVLITKGLGEVFRSSVHFAILIVILGVLHVGIGFFLFFSGMEGLGAQSIAVLSYIDPLTSLLISAIVFGQRMNGLEMTGAVLILGSTFITEPLSKEILSRG